MFEQSRAWTWRGRGKLRQSQQQREMDSLWGHADGATRTVYAASAAFASFLAKLIFIKPRFEKHLID
jgi:hypothetical protein